MRQLLPRVASRPMRPFSQRLHHSRVSSPGSPELQGAFPKPLHHSSVSKPPSSELQGAPSVLVVVPWARQCPTCVGGQQYLAKQGTCRFVHGHSSGTSQSWFTRNAQRSKVRAPTELLWVLRANQFRIETWHHKPREPRNASSKREVSNNKVGLSFALLL